jgi:hypothetical protein
MGRSVIVDRDQGWERIQREIRSMDGKSVTAGLHEKDAGEEDPNAVMRGYYNEIGAGNNPARPFLRTTHDERKYSWARTMQKDFARVIDGLISGQGMMESIGEIAAADIRQSIVRWDDPPNAPRTIAQKGFDDPLIETGEMRDAVDYEVRDDSA